MSSFIKADETLSFSLRKNSSGFSGCLNNKGLVNIDQRATRKISSFDRYKPVIHFFGDSYTFGFGVSDDETFTSLLGQVEEGYTIKNYSVPGWGITQMFLRYQEIKNDLKNGDMVLFTPIYRDFFRDLHSPGFVFWMLQASGLKMNKFPIFSESKITYRNLNSLNFFILSSLYLSNIVGREVESRTTDRQLSLKTSIEMIKELKADSKNRGVGFDLLILPELKEDLKRHNEITSKLLIDDYTKLALAELSKNMENYRTDCDSHYSLTGHRNIAKILKKFIIKKSYKNRRLGSTE